MSTTPYVISCTTTGSLVQSGCGPATPVSGTAAAYSGDGAGAGNDAIITFTNTPDLSNVVAGHILFLNVAAGERYLLEITAVDNSAKTVTCLNTVTTAIASGSAVDYYIGGTRTGPARSTTETDWKWARGKWIFEYDDGTYDITLSGLTGRLDLNTDVGYGVTSDGLITIRALNMPTNPRNCTVRFSWDSSQYANTLTKRIRAYGGAWTFQGIKIGPSNASNTGCWDFVQHVRVTDFYLCSFVNDMTSAVYNIRYANDGEHDSYHACLFTGKIGFDKSFNSGDSCFYYCVFDTITGSFLQRPHGNHVLMYRCIFYECTGVVLSLQASNSFGIVNVIECTFYLNGSDAISFAYATPSNFGLHFLHLNTFVSNGGYGINGYSAAFWAQLPDHWHDANHYHNNTSGDKSHSEPIGANSATGDPKFANTTAGSVDLSYTAGSALSNSGLNPLITGD